MIAVIKTGGKQYLVREGDEIKVEKVSGEKDASLSFEVLFVSDENGENMKLGTPTLPGIAVHATVLEHGRGKKVAIIKFKRKVRYRRKTGHRQPYSKVKIAKVAP
ncbi:50S ribosomal protein L21 [Candidatus Uhrbacteria bacterium]|nr:50S ribosomal protein L21 [Candidatus Uhrbacteria bacterium]